MHFPALVGIGREVPVWWNRDCSREMLDAPHLLVVGARKSLRHRLGAAQARGQVGGAVAVASDRGGDRVLQPPPPVFS